MKNINSEKAKRKGQLLIAEIILLSVMLLITTYALFSNVASVNNNTFSAQGVSIEINNGERLFNEENLLLQPGKSCEKIFTVKNTGSADAYFQLFLENVAGNIVDAVNFEICTSSNEIVYKNNAHDFTKANPYIHNVAIKAGQEIQLKMVVGMADGAGNTYQDSSIVFDVVAQSIQAKNNDSKVFTK